MSDRSRFDGMWGREIKAQAEREKATTDHPAPEAQLEPCPFCGSSNLHLSDGYDEDSNWVVVCRVCRCSGTFCAIRATAIARWNTRSRAPVAAPVNDAQWLVTGGNGFYSIIVQGSGEVITSIAASDSVFEALSAIVTKHNAAPATPSAARENET